MLRRYQRQLIGLVVLAAAGSLLFLFIRKLERQTDMRIRVPSDAATSDEEARSARFWTADQVERQVRHFVFEVPSAADAVGEETVLHSLGAKLHPAIMAILDDGKVQRKLTEPVNSSTSETPIAHICELLSEKPPPTVLGSLVPYLDDPSASVRKEVARVIGNIGTTEIIDPIRTAFADADEEVRTFAMIGIERADRDRQLQADCKKEIWKDIQEFIVSGRNAHDAVNLLMDLDQGEAVAFLTSPAALNPSRKALHPILKTLAEWNVPVPRESLLELIKGLEALPLEYPQTYALGEALKLLGRHQNIEDRAFLEARMLHRDESIAGGAATGLLASYGLEGFERKIAQKEEANGPAALTVVERNIAAIDSLDAEIRGGGHAKYFLSSSGNRWQDALDGLNAVGGKKLAAILGIAVNKFGQPGPATNLEERQAQIAKILERDHAAFESVDDQYRRCSEKVIVLTARYIIANADQFR